jgi:hypothetical protein
MDYVTRQFITLTKKFRREIRTLLEKQTQAINDATKASRESKKDLIPVPVPVVATLNLPEAQKTERTKRENRAHAVQIWLAFATTLAFIAAAVYAWETNSILREAQKQTTAAQLTAKAAQDQADLLGKQLEGTQAAKMVFSQPPQIQIGSPGFGELLIYLRNKGVVNAPTVSFSFTLSSVPIGNGKLGGDSKQTLVLASRTETYTEFAPPENPVAQDQPFRTRFDLPKGFYDSQWTTSRSAIKLTYTLKFDNGFSHPALTKSDCDYTFYGLSSELQPCTNFSFQYKGWLESQKKH